MTTYSQKPSEVERKWYLIDASETTLGRLSVVISKYLLGKYKPTYTPHIDGGDNVVVINAENVKVTGDKKAQKRYYRHSGYPGGLRSLTMQQQLERNPAKVVEQAVKGMLPTNKLLDQRMMRLKVYPGNEHPHTAQKPIKLSLSNDKVKDRSQ